jgi:hypothetical protein
LALPAEEAQSKRVDIVGFLLQNRLH